MEVEIALNRLPEPEYRQLMVEAMMVLATMVENDNHKVRMDHLIPIDSIVQEANRIFIADQVRAGQGRGQGQGRKLLLWLC